MWGTVVNALAIILGSLAGLLVGKHLTNNLKDTLEKAVSLGVILVGVQMAIKSENILIVLLSLVIGGAIGETLDIEKRLAIFATKAEKLFNSSGDGQFAKGFVTSTLVYCVGAMAIIGSLEGGLTGVYKTLYAKSILDGISSIVFASTLGVGVLFSSVSVFVYQGLITVFAGVLKVYLTNKAITEMTATGGLLILGIALRMMKVVEIRVGNLLPALVVAVLLSLWLEYYAIFAR